MDAVVPARPDGPRGAAAAPPAPAPASAKPSARRRTNGGPAPPHVRPSLRGAPSYVGRGSSDPRRPGRPRAKPILPANIPEYFLSAAAAPEWRGVLYGSARIHYTDAKLGIDTVQDLHVTAPFADGAVPVDWDNAEPAAERPEDLVPEGPSAGLVRAAATRRARRQEVRRVDQGLRAMGDARRAADALLGAGGEAHVARRRERTRFPPAAAPGGARVARRRGGEAPRQLRRQGGAAHAARRHRRRQGVRARGGSGVAAEDADDGLVRRHRAWRAARTKSGQRLHARPRHHRRPRRRPLGQGDAGRRARQGEARRRTGGAEGAGERAERGDCRAHRRGRRRRRPSRPSRSSRSAAAWTCGSWRSPGSPCD